MLIFIHGNNTFDSYIELNKYKIDFAKKNFEIELLDADDIDGSVLNNVLDFSTDLFAKSKILILKRLSQNNSAVIEKFCNFVKNNIDNQSLNIVLWEDEMINKKSKLNDVLKYFEVKVFETKEYEKKTEATNLAKSLSNSFELNLKNEEITNFVNSVGFEKFDIYYEMKKLNSLNKNKEKLDFDSLSLNENLNVFAFISKFFGNYDEFLKALNYILLDKQLYSLILSLLVTKLITQKSNKILEHLARFDFEFKSGNLEEDDVFILTYKAIHEN